MAIINTDIYLDMIPGGVMQTLHVPQYDSGLRRFTFHLTNNGVAVTIPAGYTAVFAVQRPGTVGHEIPLTFNTARDSVILDNAAMMTTQPGLAYGRVAISDAGDLNHLYSENIMVMVEADPIK